METRYGQKRDSSIRRLPLQGVESRLGGQREQLQSRVWMGHRLEPCDITFRMFGTSGSSGEEMGVDTASGREKSVEKEG